MNRLLQDLLSESAGCVPGGSLRRMCAVAILRHAGATVPDEARASSLPTQRAISYADVSSPLSGLTAETVPA